MDRRSVDAVGLPDRVTRLQNIADFRQQLDIGRRRGRCGIRRLLFFHGAELVHALDHEEDDEGEDEKVDRDRDEAAIASVKLNT